MGGLYVKVEASHRAVDAGHDAPRFAAAGCHISGANDVAVHCTGRAPAAVLPPAHRLKLLVVNFECTGGVSIGNEYWGDHTSELPSHPTT